MWPDRVSNPGPLTYESGALPIALRGPAVLHINTSYSLEVMDQTQFFCHRRISQKSNQQELFFLFITSSLYDTFIS